MALGNCPSPAESESAHVSLETECGLPHHGGRAHASKANLSRLKPSSDFITHPSTYLSHNNHTYL